jgi:hypothetical protein
MWSVCTLRHRGMCRPVRGGSAASFDSPFMRDRRLDATIT